MRATRIGSLPSRDARSRSGPASSSSSTVSGRPPSRARKSATAAGVAGSGSRSSGEASARGRGGSHRGGGESRRPRRPVTRRPRARRTSAPRRSSRGPTSMDSRRRADACGLAVDHEGRGRRFVCGREPGQQLVVVGVNRERRKVHDLGAHRDVAAQQLDLPGAVEEPPAAGLLGLEADQHDRGPVVGQVAPEVVQDPAAGGHPRRGHDDRRGGELVELLGLLDLVHRVHGGESERVLGVAHLRADLRCRPRRWPAGRRRAWRAPWGCPRRWGDRGWRPPSAAP